MEVDSRNFKKALELIKNIIQNKQQKCNFVAFDFEMTGIKGTWENYDDLPFERYTNWRNVTEKFALIQSGICFFIQNSQMHYNAIPFNFYIILKNNKVQSCNINLDCDTVNFHVKNQLDFNRWLYYGIPFMTKQKQSDLYTQYFGNELQSNNNLKTTNASDQTQEETSSQAQTSSSDLLKKCNEEQIKKCNETIARLETWNNSNQEKQIVILENNAFIRKIYYQYIAEKYPHCIKKKDENSKAIILVKSNEEEKQKFTEEEKQKKMEEYEDFVGFSQVINLLIESKLPIVGQNCLYDLLFLFSNFIGRLPNDYFTFKSQIHQFFPTIIDNKYVAKLLFECLRSQRTSLEDLKEYIEMNQSLFEELNISSPPDFDSYNFDKLQEQCNKGNKDIQNKIPYHTAGFDAYLTGWIYAKLIFGAQKLFAIKNNSNANPVQNPNIEISAHGNKLNLYNSYYVMNLDQQNDDNQNINTLYLIANEHYSEVSNKKQNNKENQQKIGEKSSLILEFVKEHKQHIEIRNLRQEILFLQLNKTLNEQEKLNFEKDLFEGLKSLNLKILNHNDYILNKLTKYKLDNNLN